MAESLLSDDERDQFGELVNIAMGRAGADLAEAFSGFVHLRIPEIRDVNFAKLNVTRERLAQTYTRISILHQEFIGELAGDIAIVYGPASYAALREVLGFDDRDGDGRSQREELLLELGNALASTFITSISKLLNLRTGLRPPRMALFDELAKDAVRRLFVDSCTSNQETLQIAIIFHLEKHEVPFELLINLAPDCLTAVRNALSLQR